VDEPVQRVARDVTARGVRMRVVEAGDESAPALLMIHGFLASHLDFDDVIDPLARRFHVLAPDLPGFGASEKPNPARYSYGVEAFSEAMADLIAAYGLGQANVMGHGIGGAFGITLASRYAELVQRLVLIDPLCYPSPPVSKLKISLAPVIGPLVFKQLYGRRLFRSYFHDEVYSPEARLPVDRIDRFYDNFNTPSARESAYAVLRSMLDNRPVVARVTRVRRPTLVVWGRDDRLFPASQALRLAREIPEAKLEVMNAGHAPHAELPKAFVAVVREFLEGRR
jgi:pimeloyl-ACP methyl ester carboxylesterase